MNFQTFADSNSGTYPIAILSTELERDRMVREYLQVSTAPSEDFIAYQLYLPIGKKKATAAEQREYLDELIPTLEDLGTKFIVVSNGEYFKTLTGTKKHEAMLGYVVPNSYPADKAGQFQVLFCPNYRQVFHNPAPTRAKIKMAFDALTDFQTGVYSDPGHGLLKTAVYPESLTDIKIWLDKLIEMDCDLKADIEGFSLHHVDAGVGTISFAWNKHEGIAFPVDLGPNGVEVRAALKQFFYDFQRNMTWHHISYDVTVLIYQLFMEHIIDTEGLLEGLEVMLKDWDDTKLITYLATNTCAGNKLGLKEQAQEFAGNYAVEEIKDITKIPLPKLLEYNLVDACSTWYVEEKHWDTMVEDGQLSLYQDLFKPAIVDIIQMQLTGLPVDMEEVLRVEVEIGRDRNNALDNLRTHPAIVAFVELLNQEAETDRYNDWCDRKAAGVKVREYTPLDPKNYEVFKPGSPQQLQKLFYQFLELPIKDRTDTNQPATGADSLEKLKAFTDNEDQIALINTLLDFKAVDKIFNTFIPAFLGARKGPDDWHYLFGSFNLGGTVSGRLSSSNPNLQTIPANGSTPLKKHYAKLIKRCVKAPPGWIFAGLDYDSLEDRISALTTKDRNKIKVYTDGFDGHCLRAQSYFEEDMPEIDPTSVESINSIKVKYPDQRQDSKVPTFLLTYQGTFIGMMAQCGFDEAKAKRIEARYHELYKESDAWIEEKLEQATHDGYVTAAFGLRVRTPLLAQVVRNNSKVPHEADAEGRTAGNAMGQSWGLLNSRAWVEFMAKVRKSEYRLDIRPCAQIHDAGYALIRDDIHAVAYANEHLVEAVSWQDHPDIYHDEVKLSGALSIFYPSWAEEIEIPNGTVAEQLPYVVANELQKREQKKAA